MSLPRPSPSSPYFEVVRLELRAGVTRSESFANHDYSLVVAALERSQGNVSRTAAALDIHRNTLDRMMREFNLAGFARQLRQLPRRQLRLVFEPPKAMERVGGKTCELRAEESVRRRA
jgi:transposase-like protein